MKVLLLIIIWFGFYIRRVATTHVIPTTIPAHTNLPNVSIIQTKLQEIGKLEILEAEYQTDYVATAQTIQLLKNDKKYKQLLNSIVDRLTKDQIILTAKGKVIVWFDFKAWDRQMKQSGDVIGIKTEAEILHTTISSIVVSQRNTGILKKLTWIDLTLEEYARQEWLDRIVAQAKQDKILEKTYPLWEQVLLKLFEIFGIKKVIIWPYQ